MKRSIPEILLLRLSAAVSAAMGLHFPKERWRDLERGIKAAAPELGMKDGRSCAEWLLSTPLTRTRVEILARHLTIGETYFFRDKRLFSFLEQHLSEIVRLRRNGEKYLRIWSAGCSSGEEPYSVAILLSRIIPEIRDWDITILATDINDRLLRKAADGVYGRWSFRDVPPGIQEGFFRQKDVGRFEIQPRIREMVTLSYLNLVESMYPSGVNHTEAVDIILCRNVLMYLVPEIAGRVVKNLNRSLTDGGLLIVGPTESYNIMFSDFTPVKLTGVTLYKKEIRRKETAPSRIAPTIPAVTPPQLSRPVQSPAAVVDAPAVSSKARDASPERKSAEFPLPRDLYRQASALLEKSRYLEAVDKTRELLSQEPSSAEGMALLARIYANWGKLAKALDWCEKALRADSLRSGHHYLMATILQELGRVEEAVISLKKTLYLDPRFVPAYVTLGNIFEKSGRHKESAKHFENALLLLKSLGPEEVFPGSEGINAERLAEIIRVMQRSKAGR